MTRRIAVAILLTTWTALIVIGVATYLAARHVLLTNLDDSIVARASALPSALGVAATANGSVPAGDRYVIRSPSGRTLARPTTATAEATPAILGRAFTTLGDGTRMRTLTLALAPNSARADSAKPITITYSASAQQFDRLLNKLAIWLGVVGGACGLCAAGAAVILSRLSLRPLLQTADTIGTIDERQLARRIDGNALPTELRPMARRLNEMLARLEQAFDQRRRFMADASHELRTPVAAIVTTIEVALRRPREAAELTDSLRACLSDAAALRHLVDRLMQRARSEAPVFEESAAPFDAVAVLEECAESVTRAEGEKRVVIKRQLPDRLYLTSGSDRLRGIAMNLLTNAVEYSDPDGTVDLSCDVGDEVMIFVSDHGPGISPELLPRLFEPFARAGTRPNGNGRHLGLGLSIVQAHVQALGGRCEVQSVPGSGATFRVLLPKSLVVPNSPVMAVE